MWMLKLKVLEWEMCQSIETFPAKKPVFLSFGKQSHHHLFLLGADLKEGILAV